MGWIPSRSKGRNRMLVSITRQRDGCNVVEKHSHTLVAGKGSGCEAQCAESNGGPTKEGSDNDTRTNDTVDKLITRNSGTPTLVSRCFDNYSRIPRNYILPLPRNGTRALSLAPHLPPSLLSFFLIKPSFPCRNLRLKTDVTIEEERYYGFTD